MDDAISNYPKKEKGGLLTIVGDSEVGEPCMFGKVMYFSVYYFCVILRTYIEICWRTKFRKREIRT